MTRAELRIIHVSLPLVFTFPHRPALIFTFIIARTLYYSETLLYVALVPAMLCATPDSLACVDLSQRLPLQLVYFDMNRLSPSRNALGIQRARFSMLTRLSDVLA